LPSTLAARLARIAVVAVPMLAPNTNGTAASSVRIPWKASPSTIPIVAALACAIAVNRGAAIRAGQGSCADATKNSVTKGKSFSGAIAFDITRSPKNRSPNPRMAPPRRRRRPRNIVSRKPTAIRSRSRSETRNAISWTVTVAPAAAPSTAPRH
jgi:hypothetical protein